jgi:uncharacterized Fe-S cluster-containing MiaB family protein
MFIDDVVTHIWEPYSVVFREALERAEGRSAEELYAAARSKAMAFVSYENTGTNCNLLQTSACSYRVRGRKLVGCSMCDYHTTNIDGWAEMRALRKKSLPLYNAAVRASFVNVRGEDAKGAFCEQVTANDCLDPVEYPEELIDELFGARTVFADQPRSYLFEVLPTNVTPGRVERLRARLNTRRPVFFDFGAECTEWLRVHWLNKRISDAVLRRAVEVMKRFQIGPVADMLFGLPGLTEEQSILVFEQSVKLLLDLGVERIVCLPLNRKRATLQGYLHTRLADSALLTSRGLAQGEHTGLPWLFSLLAGLCRLRESCGPEVYRKLTVVATRPEFVTGRCETSYNGDPACECNVSIVEALERYQLRRDPEPLWRLNESFAGHRCHQQWRALREQQRAAGGLRETLRLLAEAISQDAFPGAAEARLQGFERELASLPAGAGPAPGEARC